MREQSRRDAIKASGGSKPKEGLAGLERAVGIGRGRDAATKQVLNDID